MCCIDILWWPVRVRSSRRSFGWTQDASTRTQDARRVAAGAVDAKRPQSGRKTPAVWTQNARRRSAKLFLGSTVLHYHAWTPGFCGRPNFFLVLWDKVLLQKIIADTGSHFNSIINSKWPKHLSIDDFFAHSSFLILWTSFKEGRIYAFPHFPSLFRIHSFGRIRNPSAYKQFLSCLKRVVTIFSLNQIDSSTWQRRFLTRFSLIR